MQYFDLKSLLLFHLAFGKTIAMTLKIDNLGRVVVPKPLRQKLGIEPGTDLEINES